MGGTTGVCWVQLAVDGLSYRRRTTIKTSSVRSNQT
jgi:hypothetical protein